MQTEVVSVYVLVNNRFMITDINQDNFRLADLKFQVMR